MRRFRTAASPAAVPAAAQAMRDPFSDAWVGAEGGNGTRPDPNRRKEPLEAFPLDALDMVGT
ncbi:pilus assembly protein PilP, partial [Xanthomonas fragariae]|uniref:pilus assembly protein PilP n=1 Tax=Xanthomonas fragariae TaxID=48664 RepID=UPI003CCE7D44